MPSKKSKSRFTDLVKFVPEEIEEAPIQRRNSSGIQTNVLSSSSQEETKEVKKSEKRSAEEYKPEFIDKDDIPEIEQIIPEEIEYEEENEMTENVEDFYEDNVESKDEIDAKDLIQDIDIEDEIEESIEEENEKNMEEYEMEKSSNYQQNINETIILGNTTIKGDIITDTGIQVYGAVLGNIESGGRVQLVGKVEGNITGKSVYVTNTSQTGDIVAETEVHIKEGCTIEGDVHANKVFLKGTVIGNIEAEGQVDFESGSEIRGNVSAHSFNIKPGAKINGSISTN